MNDYDPIDTLLADLRTDVPEMSDEAFVAGRARLQAVIETIPATTEPQPDVVVVPLPKKRFLRSPPRRLIASAAAAVVLAAGVLFLQAARSDSPVPVASAGATLNSAADNINQVDEPIEPGQYRYFVSHSWGTVSYATGLVSTPDGPNDDPGPFTAMEEWVYEQWVPADLTQPCMTRSHATGARKWLEGDEERARAAGIEPQPTEVFEEVTSCTGGGDWSRNPSAEFLASLPRDPRQLYNLLRDMPMPVAMSQASWVMNRVTTTLVSGRAPADLRAALYRALALLPGLQVTEQVANLDGQQGTALGLRQYGGRHDLIIDPDTGQYIGERTVNESGDRDVPPGTIMSYSSFTNPVIVDAIGVKPAR